MKTEWNIPAPMIAAARHVVSFSMGAIAFGSAAHIITVDDANKLTGAITALVSGITTLSGAIATILAVVSALFASFSATNSANIQRVVELSKHGDEASTTAILEAAANHPAVDKIITTPELAVITPSPKVVSET